MLGKYGLRAEDTYLKHQGWEPWTLYYTTQAFARASCFYDHFAHFRVGIGACLASFCHFLALGRSSHLNGCTACRVTLEFRHAFRSPGVLSLWPLTPKSLLTHSLSWPQPPVLAGPVWPWWLANICLVYLGDRNKETSCFSEAWGTMAGAGPCSSFPGNRSGVGFRHIWSMFRRKGIFPRYEEIFSGLVGLQSWGPIVVFPSHAATLQNTHWEPTICWAQCLPWKYIGCAGDNLWNAWPSSGCRP